MTVQPGFSVGGRSIGLGQPVYVVAELSANHNQSFDEACELVRTAARVGADAVKLQTYSADSMTIASDTPWLTIGEGTPWSGRRLHDLYQEAQTPWAWQGELRALALECGIDLFSSAFDSTSVEFLEGLGVPAYKVASFELVDLELIAEIARTGKPMIMSTGMARVEEIEEAMGVAYENGASQVALLKCTSAYPAPVNEMNLSVIADLRQRFGVEVGLSDHTTGVLAPSLAVALGAVIIEKHLTRSRDVAGPDSSFSLEPDEFQEMVLLVRSSVAAIGEVRYGPTNHEMPSLAFRRSLFVVSDVRSGEEFTRDNVRAIRPGDGLAPKHLLEVLGRRATLDIERGTPLTPDAVQGWDERAQ